MPASLVDSAPHSKLAAEDRAFLQPTNISASTPAATAFNPARAEPVVDHAREAQQRPQ